MRRHNPIQARLRWLWRVGIVLVMFCLSFGRGSTQPRLDDKERPQMVRFNPSAISIARQAEPQEFRIVVSSPLQRPTSLSVTLALTVPGQPTRRFLASRVGEDTYAVRAVPIPSGGKTKTLLLTVPSEAETLVLRVTDRKVKVGKRTIALSDIQQIEQGVRPSVLMRGGERIVGRISELKAMETSLAGLKAAIDLSEVSSLQVHEAPGVSHLDYVVTVKQGNEVVDELGGTIPLQETAGQVENAALGKPVTGSVFWEDPNPAFSCQNITDGVGNDTDNQGLHSFWLTPDGSGGNAVIDLRGSYLVSSFQVQNTHNRGFNDRGAKDFSIDISSDRLAWTSVLRGTLSSVAESGEDIPWETFRVKPVLAKFVRFTIRSFYGSGGGLNELRVLGTSVGAPRRVWEPPSK